MHSLTLAVTAAAAAATAVWILAVLDMMCEILPAIELVSSAETVETATAVAATAVPVAALFPFLLALAALEVARLL